MNEESIVTLSLQGLQDYIGLQMNRELRVFGLYRVGKITDSFTGIVTFEERGNSIYYSWTLLDKEGILIGAKSLNVEFQQIPPGKDRFDFVKAHAIQGIEEYRIGREKIVRELRWD